MSEQTFTTSPTPHITVDTCGGDLSIEGTAVSEVMLTYEADSSRIQREGETLKVISGSDCRITCPPASTITVRNVGGDFSASDLSSTLAVESVAGDASLRGAGVVTFQSAGGDLSARDVSGDLRVGSIGGDLEVRRIEGQLIVDRAGGDLSARHLNGGARIHCAGDVSIEASLTAGKTYVVHAGGDLTLRLPPDADAQFKLSASGEIDNRVGFNEWSGDRHSGQGRIGAGNAQVEANAGGDLLILPTRSEFGADIFGSQFEAKMEQFERDLETKMNELNSHIQRMTAAGLTDLDERLRRVDVEGITRRASERAERAAERAAERMREKVARARQQAERSAERARHRAERGGKSRSFSFGFGSPKPPAPPSPAQPAATEAERLMILRLLEQKKISTEEAAKLLEALEA
jgi:hypothetical protein